MIKINSFLFRFFFVVLILFMPFKLMAYNNHTGGGELILGLILVLILGPIVKCLGYILIIILSNKWTWIIGGGLLFIAIIASIDNNNCNKNNTPTYNNNGQQYPVNNNPLDEQYSNQLNSNNSVQNTVTKEQRIEEYYTTCPSCGGSSTMNCQYCGGLGYVSTTCSCCNGSGGKAKFKCISCGGKGYLINTIDGTELKCDFCNGAGYEDVYCTHCFGTGKSKEFCKHCNFFEGSKKSCSTCNGTGVVKSSRIVDYYE